MREPYARNEELPALVLTEHSWCLERDVLDVTKWIVTYPGITQDLVRAFDNEAEAKQFARTRRDRELHRWRAVKVEKSDDNCVTMTPGQVLSDPPSCPSFVAGSEVRHSGSLKEKRQMTDKTYSMTAYSIDHNGINHAMARKRFFRVWRGPDVTGGELR